MTKDALLAAVWPETVVSEDVLTVAVPAAPPGVGRSGADALVLMKPWVVFQTWI